MRKSLQLTNRTRTHSLARPAFKPSVLPGVRLRQRCTKCGRVFRSAERVAMCPDHLRLPREHGSDRMSAPETFAVDRSMRVPPGHIVCTAWVDIWQVTLASGDQMAVGDVDRAYQRALQRGDCAGWPCPVGYWDKERFVLTDGRHEYVATLMTGRRCLFVAWVEKK